MWQIAQIPRPTPARPVTEPENFPPIINEPVNPVSFAPPPGTSSGSGGTPLGTPPGSGSGKLRGSIPPPPIIDYTYPPLEQFKPPRITQPDEPIIDYSNPAPQITRFSQADMESVNTMSGLNFGGIVKGIGKFIDNKVLGGAIQQIGGMLDKPAVQKVLQAGPKYSTPGMPPMLPAIGGGVVKGGGWPDVRISSSSTAPYGRRRYRRMNPMNVKALRRAARRLESGEKLFRKVFSISHGHAAGGKIRPKRRRRAS